MPPAKRAGTVAGVARVPWARYLAYGLAAFAAVVVAGTLVYWVMGRAYGRDWELHECLYMVVITVTHTGYSDILSSHEHRLPEFFTLALTIVGMGVLPFAAAMMTGMIVDGVFTRLLEGRRMEKRIQAMKGHVIVCGAGQTGLHVINELYRTGREFVVIEEDEQRMKWVLEHVGPLPYVVGDASEDEVLEGANVRKARALVCTLGMDKDNLFAVISARSMNAGMFVVSRVIEASAEAKLLRAGANRVVNANIIGGMRMASEIIRPETVTFLDAMLRHEEDVWRFQELVVGEGCELAGRKLADSRLRDFGNLSVVAVRERSQSRFTYNPPASTEFTTGMVVVFLANVKDLAKLESMFEGKE